MSEQGEPLKVSEKVRVGPSHCKAMSAKMLEGRYGEVPMDEDLTIAEIKSEGGQLFLRFCESRLPYWYYAAHFVRPKPKK